MKYTFVPLVILKNSPCPWTRLAKIAHMLDNNIGSTTNKYQKIDQTLENRVLNTTSQHHAVNSNSKILPSVLKNKKTQQTLPVVFIPPSKYHAYTIPSLSSQQNRRLIPSDRSCSKINISYQTKKQAKQFLKPAPPVHIMKKQSNLDNIFLHTTFFSPDLNCKNKIYSSNKTNMSNSINYNNLIPISIPPHINNDTKLAKSIFPNPTSIIQQIFPSVAGESSRCRTRATILCR